MTKKLIARVFAMNEMGLPYYVGGEAELETVLALVEEGHLVRVSTGAYRLPHMELNQPDEPAYKLPAHIKVMDLNGDDYNA